MTRTDDPRTAPASPIAKEIGQELMGFAQLLACSSSPEATRSLVAERPKLAALLKEQGRIDIDMDGQRVTFLHEAGKVSVNVGSLTHEQPRPTPPSSINSLMIQGSVSGSIIVLGNDNTVLTAPPLPSQDELARARARYQDLPIDVLPELQGPLPARWRVTYRRNPLFVGRTEDMLAITRALRSPDRVLGGMPRVVVLTGMAGIGKTQLAVEIAYRYGRFFDAVLWVRCGTPEALPAEIAACGEERGLGLWPMGAKLDLKDCLERVLAAWQSPLPRLLIFDNCESEELLHQYLPTRGACAVLVTSRRPDWDPHLDVKPHRVQTFPSQDSRELLHRLCSEIPAEHPTLGEIAELVGNHPLALRLAGSYLHTYRKDISLESYLERLRVPPEHLLSDESFQGSRIAPTDRIEGVRRTFALCYERLDLDQETDRRSHGLLACAAHLAPGELIPRQLLRLMTGVSLKEHRGREAIAISLQRLTSLGLIEEQDDLEGALRLHRLLASYTRGEIGSEGNVAAQKAVERTVIDVMLLPRDMGFDSTLFELQPHAHAAIQESFHRYLDAGDYENAAGAQIIADRYFLPWGSYALVAQRHEHVVDRIASSSLRIRSLASLANALLESGNVDEALARYQQAHDIAQKTRDEEDEAAMLGQIGVCYQLLGRPEEALRCFYHALRRARLHGQALLAAKWLQNLANEYLHQGYIRRARRQYELARGLAGRGQDTRIREEVQAMCQLNLGLCHFLIGQTAPAIAHYEYALAVARRRGDKRMAAICLGNLGECYVRQEQFERAHEHLDQALAHCQTFGLRHSRGSILHTLAELAADEGDLARAIQAAQEGIGHCQNVGDRLGVGDNYMVLARTLLYGGDDTRAKEAALLGHRESVMLNRHSTLLLLAVAELRLGEQQQASSHFATALEESDRLLERCGDHVAALETRWLACQGLVLCNGDQTLEKAYEGGQFILAEAGMVLRTRRLHEKLMVQRR